MIAGLSVVGVRAFVHERLGSPDEHALIHDAAAVDASKLSGMAIVAAIEKFKTERGAMPASLSELTPTYLPSIPLPSAGRNAWRYHADAKGYSLAFGVGRDAYPGYYYRSSSGTWAADF